MADIFVGGFEDGGIWDSKIVRQFQKDYAQTHSGSIYFEWDPTSKIVEYLDKLPIHEQINLIGHSYGGDTAGCIAAAYGRRINVLITIDPVGHTGSDTMRLIRDNCTVWVDVYAKPNGSGDPSQPLAWIGSRWRDEPKDIANFYIEAPFDHEEFSNLMSYPGPNGLTAGMILECYRAAAHIPEVKSGSLGAKQ
jgi:pimeloyl-ACP methyl ester carboxylesterase